MSLTCPIDLDTSMLRREISAMYARVATTPEGEFHFHRGPTYAVRRDATGYSASISRRCAPQSEARAIKCSRARLGPECVVLRKESANG